MLALAKRTSILRPDLDSEQQAYQIRHFYQSRRVCDSVWGIPDR